MVRLERREHRRVSLERPCKLYLPRVGRYVSGITWNLSSGGAMILLDHASPLQPGDRLYVGVALKRRQAVLSATEMIQAGVVRIVPTADDGVALALQFHGQPREPAAVIVYPRAA